jgi:erythromycin esterase
MRYLFLIIMMTVAKELFSQDRPELDKALLELDRYTIVGMGEEGHGFESINKAKAAVLGSLHNNLHFKGLLFESSFTLSVIAYLNADPLDLRMRNFLYPFWNTGSVREALEPFHKDEKNTHQLLIMGFDLQEDCRFPVLTQYLLSRKIIQKQKRSLQRADSLLALYIGKRPSKKGVLSGTELQFLLADYDSVEREMGLNVGAATMELKLLERCLYNRKILCHYLAKKSGRMSYRDSVMAENIIWTKAEIFKEQKIALWAANLHISKSGKEPKWMGEWIDRTFMGLYGSIVFYNKGGSYPGHNTEEYVVQKGVNNDLAVYCKKKIKIKPEEWITPCNNY